MTDEAGGIAITVRRDRRSPNWWAVHGPGARRIGTVKPVHAPTACWWALNRDGGIQGARIELRRRGRAAGGRRARKEAPQRSGGKTVDNLERRTAEYVEMLRQIQGSAAGGAGPAAMELTTGGDPHEQAAFLAAWTAWRRKAAPARRRRRKSPAAARAALVSADQLLATVSGILDGLAFGEAEVEGHPAAVVLEAARGWTLPQGGVARRGI